MIYFLIFLYVLSVITSAFIHYDVNMRYNYEKEGVINLGHIIFGIIFVLLPVSNTIVSIAYLIGIVAKINFKVKKIK